MRRADAARLLGVSVDAEPAAVRRAFRLWAAVTHPDQGGSPEAFDRLCAARALLLEPVPMDPAVAQESDTPTPRPRRPWSQVLRRPNPRAALVTSLLLVVALGAVPLSGQPWGIALVAVAATAVSVAVSKAVLDRPDHGHVIVTRSVSWGSVVALQLLGAALLGLPLIEALPLIAVPFVAAIALVNPGAGLWRVNVR